MMLLPERAGNKYVMPDILGDAATRPQPITVELSSPLRTLHFHPESAGSCARFVFRRKLPVERCNAPRYFFHIRGFLLDTPGARRETVRPSGQHPPLADSPDLLDCAPSTPFGIGRYSLRSIGS